MNANELIKSELMKVINQSAIEFLQEKHNLSLDDTCTAIKDTEAGRKQYLELVKEGLRVAVDKGLC